MGIKTITAEQLRRQLACKDLVLIDLRSPGEYRQGHLPGAHNCPYEYLERWKHKLPRGRRIILVCEHGNQSMMAAKKLGQEGVEVYSLIGGMHAWRG